MASLENLTYFIPSTRLKAKKGMIKALHIAHDHDKGTKIHLP
jgi:hypothetical protein